MLNWLKIRTVVDQAAFNTGVVVWSCLDYAARSWRRLRRALAWILIRHCAKIEQSQPRNMSWYWTRYDFWFRMAHTLYPHPPGEPSEPIGFNALETVYCWKFLEEDEG